MRAEITKEVFESVRKELVRVPDHASHILTGEDDQAQIRTILHRLIITALTKAARQQKRTHGTDPC